MAPSVKHTFVSPIPDGGDPTIVGPNAWNADHALVGVQGTIALTTTGTSGASTFDGTTLNIPNYAPGGSGTVTTVSVVSANGLAGTVANPTTTPAITLSTTITGLLKGDGTSISAASAGTDYQAPLSLTTTGTSGAATLIANTLNIPTYADTGINQLTGDVTAGPGNGSQAATVVRINGTSLAGLATGILKNTTGTGVPSIAIAGTDYQTPSANLTSWAAVTRASGFDTWVATPNSSNLRALLTDETGTGLAYFQGGDIGTPSAGVATNLSGTAASLTAGNASKWATARNLAGNSVDGSANVAFANKFIVQGTADAGLSAAQFMGGLGTGIVKNTTTTGVQSIAAAGTDYQAPITLTTTGTSGAATFAANTLNIPQYASGGSVLLATMTPSGSPATLTSANFVSTAYSTLVIVFDNLVNTGSLTFNISSDNALTFDTAFTIAGAATQVGTFNLWRAGVTAPKILVGGITGSAAVAAIYLYSRFATKTSPTTNIRFAATALTGGNAYVYGVP